MDRERDQTRTGRPPEKTFCEFFAGIGLVREGLAASGWRCVYANDNSETKRDAYEARFGASTHFHLGDVWDTPAVVERIEGRPFLATASFPCTDLSLAGRGLGLDGAHSSAFFGFAHALEVLGPRKPPLILIENVVGLLSSNQGRDFVVVARRLADLGYWLDVLVLDAAHFTPQSRPRVFVIGMAAEIKPETTRDGWFWAPEAPSPLRPRAVVQLQESLDLPTGWAPLPLPPPPARTLALVDVIDLDDDQDWWDEPEVRRHHEMMSESHREEVDRIRASGATWVGAVFRRTRNNVVRAEVRFDGLAGCLRTPRGGSAKQIVIVVDRGAIRMRWMSPREYARLQGAPDFPLVGRTIQQLWGFADAVCVPAVRWIDEVALTPLYDAAVADRDREARPCPTT